MSGRPFKPGQSGNPAGRPPKHKALTDILNKALSRTVQTSTGRIAGKRLLARLVAEGLTTGKITFPGDEKPSTIGIKDWMELAKWAYQYLEPPTTRTELTGAEGRNIVVNLSWGDTNEQNL